MALITAIAGIFLLSSTGHADHRQAQLAEYLEGALAAKPEIYQFTNLRDISMGPEFAAAGGASLIRSKNGVTARVMAADLPPGHALTFSPSGRS